MFSWQKEKQWEKQKANECELAKEFCGNARILPNPYTKKKITVEAIDEKERKMKVLMASFPDMSRYEASRIIKARY